MLPTFGQWTWFLYSIRRKIMSADTCTRCGRPLGGHTITINNPDDTLNVTLITGKMKRGLSWDSSPFMRPKMKPSRLSITSLTMFSLTALASKSTRTWAWSKKRLKQTRFKQHPERIDWHSQCIWVGVFLWEFQHMHSLDSYSSFKNGSGRNSWSFW